MPLLIMFVALWYLCDSRIMCPSFSFMFGLIFGFSHLIFLQYRVAISAFDIWVPQSSYLSAVYVAITAFDPEDERHLCIV